MGIIWDFIMSMLTESFPPKPKWTIDDIPDLSGKVIIVTGGSSGIGLEVSKTLLARGATVYIACRNTNAPSLEEVKKQSGARLLRLDLADLDSVQLAANEFLQKEERLDVLYNSGGIMIPPIDVVSAQGYDIQFATHVLGHFYFTKLLTPLMVNTAQNDPSNKPRVISVSSGAHHLHNISFDTLKDGTERRKLSPESLYAQSKFGTVVYARELARRLGDSGIVSISLNPGNVATNLQRRVVGLRKKMIAWMLHPISPNGIVTHLFAGVSREAAEYNGKYLIPWARLGKPRADTQDPKIGEDLWNWLEEQVAGR
ncbi:NAD(P)-binding protein [Irpex lacteus]|nr:NAD(P)-binding protein [Irpex lacteus]